MPDRRDEAVRLVRAGQEALAQDRLADAERDLTAAADIGRRLVAEGTSTGDASVLGPLGSALHHLGEVINYRGGSPEHAVAVLDEAERVYGRLRRRTRADPDGAGEDVDLRLADVRLLRGSTYARVGHGVSAVGDAQAAVLAYAQAAREGRVDRHQLASARVLMMASDLYGSAAGLDMALATAREGLVLVVTAANGGVPLSPALLQAMVIAADVEMAVLEATDRGAEAGNPAGLLRSLGITQPVAVFTRARLSGRRGRTGVPRRAGDGDVRSAVRRLQLITAGRGAQLDELMRDHPTLPLVAPALRVPPESLTTTAIAAAAGALRLLERDVAGGWDLGLEAHWMLSHRIADARELAATTGILNVDLPSMCSIDADVLAGLVLRAEADGDESMARDLARHGDLTLADVHVTEVGSERAPRMAEVDRIFATYRSDARS